MKKKIFVLACVLALACLYLVPVQAEAKITLTYNNYFPPTHLMSILSAEFCKEIEKRTNGEVVIQHYAGGQLLKAPKVFDGVVQGVADMGFTNLAYTRGRFPEMEICDMPLGYPSGWVSSMLANEFFKKYNPKEFAKAHILYFAACGPCVIGTVDKPVKKLEDLKGVTLRATGRISDIAQALGATARPIAIGETYEALKRHVVDGTLLPTETYKGFRLGEVLKYCTTAWQVGNVYTFYSVMNKAKYDSLPDNIKKIFDEVSAEFADKTAVGFNEIDFSGAEFFRSKGGQFIELPDAEISNWVAAVQPVLDNYAADVAQKGVLPKEETFARMQWIKEKIKELTKDQLAKGIKMPYAE